MATQKRHTNVLSKTSMTVYIVYDDINGYIFEQLESHLYIMIIRPI